MEEERVGGSGSQGAMNLDVGKPDPTQAMPVFDQGKAVDSMSAEEAQAEWKAMTTDSEGKYKDFPRSVFLSRRDALFQRGFSEKLVAQKKAQEKESDRWLEQENQRIEDRDAKEVERTLEERLVKYFGDEKTANEKVKSAQALVKKYITNPHDLQYLDDSGLGNDFEVIEMVAELAEKIEGARSRMRRPKKGGVVEREVTELTKRGGGK